MAGQGMGEYCVDIVMCIDATGSMAPIIDEVKKNAISFYEKFIESMEENDKEVETLRIKVIAFRDYGVDDEPMVQSEFFTLPDQNDEFRAYVAGIEAKGGGDIPEAVHTALEVGLTQLQWHSSAYSKMAFIILDAPAHKDHPGVRACRREKHPDHRAHCQRFRRGRSALSPGRTECTSEQARRAGAFV